MCLKGNFAFLLPILFLCILIALFYSSFFRFNFDKHLFLMRFKQASLDIKHNLILCAKYGLKEAVVSYSISSPEKLDMEELEEIIKMTIFSKFLLLNPKYKDIDVLFWCGSPSELELKSLSSSMRTFHMPLICPNCYPLSSNQCLDYINIKFENDSVIGINYGDNFHLIGFSMYSKKYNVSGVFYIPPSINLIGET